MFSRIMRPAFVALVATTLASCDNPQAVNDFFVLITNSWEVVGEPNHSFSFNAQNNSDGRTEGTFTGDEFDGGTDFTLAGSWANNRLSFTVQRASPVTYTTTLTADGLDELVFLSSAGSLRLRRQQ